MRPGQHRRAASASGLFAGGTAGSSGVRLEEILEAGGDFRRGDEDSAHLEADPSSPHPPPEPDAALQPCTPTEPRSRALRSVSLPRPAALALLAATAALTGGAALALSTTWAGDALWAQFSTPGCVSA
jgi:hypothetical protein